MSKSVSNLTSNFGKGLLIGLGIGATLFGVCFSALSMQSNQEINLGALLAIFAGSMCILIGLRLGKNKQVEPQT